MPPPPSLQTIAAGVEGKAVLEIVQRTALKVALEQVERARAAKATASPLERQRRACDAWLRVMAKVRELPTFHTRFGNGVAVPRDYDHIQGGVPTDIAQLWASRISREVRRRLRTTGRHAPYIRDRRASQGLLGRVAPSGGARQGPIAGYVLQSAASAGPSP